MKFLKLILFMSIALPTLHAGPPTWTARTDFAGTARYAAFSFAIGTTGYVGTGFDAAGNRNDFWAYNTLTNTWSQQTDFSGFMANGTTGIHIRNNVAFVIGSLAYVGMGESTQHVVEYNSATNVWTPKASITDTSSSVGVAFAIGTKGYFRSGAVQEMMNKTAFWEYDQATNTWAQKVDLGPGNAIGHVRRSAAGFAIGAYGYIGVGLDSNSVVRRDFWKYDPSTNSWTQLNDFGGTGRFNTVSFASATKGYVGLGYDAGVGEKQFWEYDPTTDSWTQILDFPGAHRSQGIGFAVGDKLYVGLGNYGNLPPDGEGYFKDFYRFSPTGEAPLPVELTTFKATTNIEKAQIDVNWETATEINNDHFVIERRGIMDIQFEPIGEVKGAGNSSKRLIYNWIDAQPLTGIAYYRLRQMDTDGAATYSKIESVTFNKGKKISIYPTITEGPLTIDNGNQRIDNVEIFNTSGQLMLRTNQTALDLSTLTRGMYLVRVQSKGQFFVEKVLKQ
jgi:N-acetylneuraminic acid mutarotase